MARTKKINIKLDFTEEEIHKAAQACYYSMGLDPRYRNLLFIFEALVLPEDCEGYTVDDMAGYIKEALEKNKASRNIENHFEIYAVE